jgi:hypothetical protein
MQMTRCRAIPSLGRYLNGLEVQKTVMVRLGASMAEGASRRRRFHTQGLIAGRLGGGLGTQKCEQLTNWAA